MYVNYLRDEKFLMKFGLRLKKLRKSKNISQSQLAYDCDMEISQISRIERGLLNTSISNAHLIAQALGIPTKKLFDF